jgi:hypothetical protein
MLGLRVHVRGRPPLTLALPQDHYLVTAGASWDRRSPRKQAASCFHGTGMDDRADHLKWFWVKNPPRRLWMDVVVVDEAVAAAPRRHPRRAIDWKDFFRKLRAKDLKRTRELEARMRQARSGTFYREPVWAAHPPALGFRVTLNRRELGRFAVSDPGALSINVYVKHRSDAHDAYLVIHGGDHVGPNSWRWRKWPRDTRRLRVGDRVRIEVVAPIRLSSSRVGRLDTTEVTDIAGITRELKELHKRLQSDSYRKEVANMLRYERERPPPRRYSRG